jgi:hypothetical protein
MFRSKKALLIFCAGSLLLSSGCLSGQLLKWLTVASELGFNTTGTLDNIGILTG